MCVCVFVCVCVCVRGLFINLCRYIEVHDAVDTTDMKTNSTNMRHRKFTEQVHVHVLMLNSLFIILCIKT